MMCLSGVFVRKCNNQHARANQNSPENCSAELRKPPFLSEPTAQTPNTHVRTWTEKTQPQQHRQVRQCALRTRRPYRHQLSGNCGLEHCAAGNSMNILRPNSSILRHDRLGSYFGFDNRFSNINNGLNN
eukprot:3155014-Rhodomonas_salina.1